MSLSSSKPNLHEKRVVVVDTETTGLDPKTHEILEIAIIELDGTILLDTKIKPAHIETAHPKALEINGYKEEGWANAPTFDEVRIKIIESLKDSILVGHNCHFDRNFIVEALVRVGVEEAHRKISHHTIDTITLAYEHLVPCGLKHLDLESVCKFLNVPLDRETRHGALSDAQACRAVYLMLLRATEEQRRSWTASLPQS